MIGFLIFIGFLGGFFWGGRGNFFSFLPLLFFLVYACCRSVNPVCLSCISPALAAGVWRPAETDVCYLFGKGPHSPFRSACMQCPSVLSEHNFLSFSFHLSSLCILFSSSRVWMLRNINIGSSLSTDQVCVCVCDPVASSMGTCGDQIGPSPPLQVMGGTFPWWQTEYGIASLSGSIIGRGISEKGRGGWRRRETSER